MSESNNNIPMRITQLEEKKEYEKGSYLPIAKAGNGTFKINAEVLPLYAKEMQKFEKRNIFSLGGATEGYYINANTGEPGAYSKTGYTDYIDLSLFSGSIVCAMLASSDGNTYQGAFYDENKTYISGIYKTNISTDQSVEVIVPDGARYLRYSYYLNRQNDYFITATTKESQMYVEDMDVFTLEGSKEYVYINGNTGQEVQTSTPVGCTDFINVSIFDKIQTNKPDSTKHQGAFYDKDFVFISGYATYDSLFELEVPQNAKYIRMSYVLEYEDEYFALARTKMNKVAKYILDDPLNESRFKNMKMNCLGDSITYGYIPDSGAQMSAPYPSQLKNLLGLSECRNYGISGSTVAVNSGNYQPMCLRYANMDNNADIVSVFGGTNDYGRAVYTPTLGTINDTANTTVYGALNILAEGLINKYPRAFVFFITPMRRADRTGNNGGGYSLEDVSNAIKEVAFKYNFPVLDLFSKGGFHVENADFRAIYSGNDKLHPSQAFVTEHLAPMIARFIESNI